MQAFFDPDIEGSKAEGEKWTKAWVVWSGKEELFQGYFYPFGTHLFLHECGSLFFFLREGSSTRVLDIHKGLETASHSKNTQERPEDQQPEWQIPWKVR